MRKPVAADVLTSMTNGRFTCLPLAQWLFTWCVRCNKIVTRWHYGSCPCVVYDAAPGTALGDALAELHRAGRLDEIDTGGGDA